MPTPDRMPIRNPTAARHLAGLAATSALATTALLALPLPTPPPQPAEFSPWWSDVGTATAAVALLRAVGIGLAVWSTVVAGIGMVAVATRNVALLGVWRVVSPSVLRRAVVVSAVAAGASAPGVAVGADLGEAPPVLRDLGPADPTEPWVAPILLDLGLADEAKDEYDSPAPPVTAPTTPADVWIVERGDHLWRVAAETLAERGESPDDGAIADYWRRVIEHNRETIGPDPDLIHPGTVLMLP